MDSLGSLNAFVRAAEAQSFTVAGRQLGVSSSAIGKAVARMEDRLGVRLLHRSTRSIKLTTEGALFLERCRRIFSEIEAAELELLQTQEPRGTLRVGLPLAGMLMMPTLVAFMRVYTEITLDLDFSDRVVDVIEEGFDAVVRFADAGDLRLMSRALGTYRRRLVAAPAYLAAKGRSQDPGRPQGPRLPAPQVSDQREVRAMAVPVRTCRSSKVICHERPSQVRSSQ